MPRLNKEEKRKKQLLLEEQQRYSARSSFVESQLGPQFPEKAEDDHFFGSSKGDEEFRNTISKVSYLLYAANNLFEKTASLKVEFRFLSNLMEYFIDKRPLSDGTLVTEEEVRSQLKRVKYVVENLPRPPKE